MSSHVDVEKKSPAEIKRKRGDAVPVKLGALLFVLQAISVALLGLITWPCVGAW